MADEVPVTEPEISEAPVETEVVETPVVADTVAETPEVSAPPTPSLHDLFREKAGLDLSSKYQSDEDLIKGAANAFSLIGKKSEKERQFDQLMASGHFQQYQQWAAQQAQQAQPQYQQPPAQPQGFQIPVLEEGDTDWVEDDPANPGGRRIMPTAPPEVRKRITERSKFVRNMQEDPSKAFGPLFERMQEQVRNEALQYSQQYTQQLFERHQREAQERAVVQSIVEKRAVQAQVRNASGQPVRDESGTFVLTPWGQAYAEREHFLNHRGISDHVLRDQLAAEYADKAVAGKSVLPNTPGATRAKTVTGGAVRGSQKVNSGTLAQKIMNENTHIGDEDHIAAIVFTD